MKCSTSTGVKAEKCISSIILRTPDGHIDAVLNILIRLLQKQTLEPFMKRLSWLLKALSQYNKNHLLICKIGNFKRPAMITNFNEVRNGYFCDPVNHRLFQFDHRFKSVISSTFWEPDDESESWRQAVDGVFCHYVQNNFKTGNCGVFGTSQNGALAVTVCIVERHHNPNNFCSSCWRSVWILVIIPELPEALLKGQ